LTKATYNSLSFVVLPMSPRNYTLSETLIHPASFVQPTSVTIGVAVDGIRSSVAAACITCTGCGLKLVKVALFVAYSEMTRSLKRLWLCEVVQTVGQGRFVKFICAGSD